MSTNNTDLATSERHRILREVQSGNIAALETFKSDFPNLHWRVLRYKDSGDTVLHLAARLGLFEVVKYLITNYKPTAIDCRNKDHKTALHEAAQFAHHEVLKLLLKHEADPSAIKCADWTPLMLACAKLNDDEEDNFKCVELLLRKRAIMNFGNKDGWTPLHLICRTGSTRILFLLLEHGLNIHRTTKNGRTALHVAALHGKLPIVKILTRLNVNVNAKDSCGNTAFHEAVLGGHLDICKYLMADRFKTDVSTKNNLGFEALHLAASVGEMEVMKYLVNDLKVHVDATSFTNLTPLHCAAKKQQVEAVTFLTSVGANPCFRDNFGRCAMEYMDSVN